MRASSLPHDIVSAIALERDAAEPLFRQLYQHLRDAILAGRLRAGGRLPPTRALGELLGVSRQTVLAAYDQLMAEGYLRGAVGRGTYVSDDLPAGRAQPKARKSALLRQVSARGQSMAQAMARVRHHEGPLRAFRASMPGIDLFPFETWRRLEARQWRRAGPHLGYGEAAGFMPLRELLCAYLASARGVVCTPEQVIITSGSQQALFLLAQVLLDPGDAVWVESPGYQGACAPLAAAGARICTVPVTAEGMDVEYGARRYPQARMVFATPSHQLPLGVTMTLPRRLELLSWAGARKAWIIEDDYDSEYRYTGPPLPSLQSLDHHGCVLYVGTLSKVMFPGLRLGYMVVPPGLVEPLARAKALVDRHNPIMPQQVMAEFIAGGHFARHIRRTRDEYAGRRAALLEAIASRLGHELACGPSDSGLDLCVHFGRPVDEQRLLQRVRELGVDVRPLSYYVNPLAGRDCAVAPGLLLGFSSIVPREIARGAALLEQALGEQKPARRR